jgi:Tfp pilus assembly protein PilX
MKRLHRGNDTGASLIIVLIIVTVVAAVMGVLLSQVDTSVRTTVVLRDQASDNYAADAAAHAVVTQLHNGKLDCSSTTGTSVTLGIDGGTGAFYAPVQTQDGPLNASATCSPDTMNGATTTTTTTTTGVGVSVDGGNLPSYALLAMEKNSLAEGITFPLSNKTICIENGSVASNAAIDATNNTLGVRISGTGSASDCSTGSSTDGTVTLGIKAYGVNGAGGCLPNKTADYKPTACSDLAAPIAVPTAPAPSDPITRTNPAAVCKTNAGKTYAAFLPGKYTLVTSATASSLNTPCKQGSSWVAADFEWFSPGTYYFDYGSTQWQWPTTLLGGTPTTGPSTNGPGGAITTPAITSVDPAVANSLTGLAGIAAFPSVPTDRPTSCADPSAQKQYPGVEFVFGGASTFTPNTGGNAELCGTYSDTDPPIAIYGASSTLTVPGGSVSAETLCTPVGAPTTCAGSLINTSSNGQAQFYFKGFVYAPAAPIDLLVKNSNGQIFNWGVVVWKFRLNVNGVTPTQPFILLPKPNQGFKTIVKTTTTYTIRYIDVWTCAASVTPCPTKDANNVPIRPNVRVRVKFDGTAGSAITVLSWSNIR